MSTSKVLEKKKNHIKLGYSKTKVQVSANNSGKSFSYNKKMRKNFTLDASASKGGGGRSKKLIIGKTTGRNTYKVSVSKNNGKMSGNISVSRKF